MSRSATKAMKLSNGSMGACREPSNHGVTEVQSQKSLSEIPSKVSFTFDFPSEETNICINLNPSLRKMTASCYDNGTRTVLKGKCERTRNPQDNEKPTESTNSLKQIVVKCTQPRPNNLLSEANSNDLSLENVSTKPNSFSFDQASNNYTIKPASTTQKIRQNVSDGSVLNLENSGLFQTTGRSSANGTYIETKRWVETTPETIETVTSYTHVTASATSCVVEKPSEVRTSNRNELLASIDRKSRERYTDSSKEVTYRCLDNAVARRKRWFSNENPIKGCPDFGREFITVQNDKDTFRRAKLMANISPERVRRFHLSQRSSTEMACMELCEDTQENLSNRTGGRYETVRKAESQEEVESTTTTQLTESECESSFSREPLGPTKSRKPVVQVTADTESSAESRATELSMDTKTKSKIFHKRTMKELYKVFQNYMLHNKQKHKTKTAFVKVFEKTAKEYFEGERGQNVADEQLESADNEFIHSEDEPSSSSVSRVSVAGTYNVSSSPSGLSVEMQPSQSETTDFDCFDGSETIYRRATKDSRRKKKSPLYSETQSTGNVPDETRCFGAGTSAAVPMTTEGDGTSNRRLSRRADIDRGVRIGHTSMNYFLSWDTDDWVQQEHMYNSTGVGVQDGGHESRRMRNGALPKRKLCNRRPGAEDVRISEVNLGTPSVSDSNAGGIDHCRGFVRENESAFEDEFMGSGWSRVEESYHSNKPVESTSNYFSESQSFEYSSSRDLEGHANFSKSSTRLYTLFSSTKRLVPENQSESDANEGRKVKLLFTNKRDTLQEEISSTGLLPKTSLDSPKKGEVSPTTHPVLCASDQTYAAKRKRRHRLTKQAHLYLQEYDKASTGSEQCMSVDQLDVTNSSLVLRRKSRKKRSGGLIFLKLRRTHPCRNLPRLMLRQEVRSSLSVCSVAESSESQLIKEVALEDIHDYSRSCCKQTASMRELSNPKWVKSMDDFIDFTYITPKITRLGNDEEIFKKGVKIGKKSLEANSEVEKQHAAVDSARSDGKRPSLTKPKKSQKPDTNQKLNSFREARKRKYNLVKFDSNSHVPAVDSQSAQLNRSQNVRRNKKEVSGCRIVSKYSQENGGNLRNDSVTKPVGQADPRMTNSPCKKGIATLFGCVTAKNSDNLATPRSNVTRISTPCNQGLNNNMPVERKLVQNEDGKVLKNRFTAGKECTRKMRRNQMMECEDRSVTSDFSSIRDEVEKANPRKVVESVEKKCTESPGPEAVAATLQTISPEMDDHNLTEVAARIKDAGKKIKRKAVIIGDTVDGRRRKTRQNTKTSMEIYDGASTSDCVNKVSFNEAFSSIRAKKGNEVLSDESWTSDETASTVSRPNKSSSIVSKVSNGITTNCQVELLQKLHNILETDTRNRTQAADPVEGTYSNNIQGISKNSNASVKRDSFEINPNIESRRSSSKCPTPTSLRTSSKYQTEAGQSTNKKTTDVTSSANKVESKIQNRLEETQESVRQTVSMKNSRSPRSIFKSVPKPNKNPEIRTPVAEPPVLDEAQKCSKNVSTIEERISPKAVLDARRRAAEYDRKNRLRLKQELLIQTRDSVRSTRESGFSSERERL